MQTKTTKVEKSASDAKIRILFLLISCHSETEVGQTIIYKLHKSSATQWFEGTFANNTKYNSTSVKAGKAKQQAQKLQSEIANVENWWQ